MTYGQLDAATNKLARLLRQNMGIQQGMLVGLYVNRSLDMVVAMIGIMKAGAGFIPIDPAYPRERIHFMLDNTKTPLIITERDLGTGLDTADRQLFLIEEMTQRCQGFSGGAISEIYPDFAVLDEQVAYVIFTSGTTGQPKGVLVPQRAVSAFLNGMIERPGLHFTDRLLTNASISFDMSTYEIFLPLAVGAELVMTSRSIAGDGDKLVLALEEFAITHMIATPATWRLILSSGWQGCEGFKAVCGGEAFPRDLADELLKRCSSVWNIYGPTETTVICLGEEVKRGADQVLLGFPTPRCELYIVDIGGKALPPGEVGELLIGGPQVSHGYLHDPELTAQKFIPNKLNPSANAPILYKSGDLVRLRPDGNLEYHGRIDHQVKIRGYRIEVGEVSNALAKWHEILFCHVIVREDRPGDKRLVAYVILKPDAPRLTITDLKSSLRKFLPEYMVPQHFMVMSSFPMTANGKVDREALPRAWSKRDDLGEPAKAPATKLEEQLVQVFADILQFDRVGTDDDLFALGLNSLSTTAAIAALRKDRVALNVATVYDCQTIARMAAYVQSGGNDQHHVPARQSPSAAQLSACDRAQQRDIAIIGMAGRFPGADTLTDFWRIVQNGEEAITHFSREELSRALPAAVVNDPNYVPWRGIVRGAENFDARFFGVAPVEAAMTDPQQRLFLEECWHAFDDAGIHPEGFSGLIGVFGGMHRSTYFQEMTRHSPEAIERYGDFNTMIATEKDYVATRVAHRLDLKGPALSVHSACSTSAVAVIEAVMALREGQCDMALAGGVAITVPQNSGHIFQEGGIQTNDGHTRPFASDAVGTVFSDGVGAILVKRLADAERDGDHIYAVIKGVGINNDGRSKSSFMAPSVSGQRACIEAAIKDAGIHPHQISHVETHGTGTIMGDPIETAALRQALTVDGVVADVAIGSIKGNFGHMAPAAGIAAVIKTALALTYEVIPPSLFAATTNPECGFDERFRVNHTLTPWQRQGGLYAGVSSFGVGGTNAHLIMTKYLPKTGEERVAPGASSPGPLPPISLVPLSAKRSGSLTTMLEQTSAAMKQLSAGMQRLNGAFTMQTGRPALPERAFALFATEEGAQQPPVVFTSPLARAATPPTPLCWVFPGQGTQYIGMASALYRYEKAFREQLDASLDYVKSKHALDLHPFLTDEAFDDKQGLLKNTRLAQPAILIVSLALAHHFKSLGLTADAVMGHSIGEFAAAVTAGIMSAETAIDLVALRGRLSADQPAGAMVAIRMNQTDFELPSGLSLAAVNSPTQIVVSGPIGLVTAMMERLSAKDIMNTRLDTSHAFHSLMMAPVADKMAQALARVTLSAPHTPFYSTQTGALLTAENAVSPTYWSHHVVAAVRFADALGACAATPKSFLEVGPRATMVGLVRQNNAKLSATASMSPSGNPTLDYQYFLRSVGGLWQQGQKIEWHALANQAACRRISMPGYAFEKQRHWVLSSDT